jgi:hypothetical protein
MAQLGEALAEPGRHLREAGLLGGPEDTNVRPIVGSRGNGGQPDEEKAEG